VRWGVWPPISKVEMPSPPPSPLEIRAAAAKLEAPPAARRVLVGLAALSVVVLLVAVGAQLAGASLVASRVLFPLDVAAAAAACLLRGVVVRCDRATWLLIGSAIASFLLGDLYWVLWLAGDSSPTFPSLADLGYLCFYPLMAAALIVGLRSPERRLRSEITLDVIAGTFIGAAVGASLLYPALEAATDGAGATIATNLAYPVADVVLIVLTMVRLAMASADRSHGWLLLGGLLCFVAADVVYLHQTALGTYREGTLLDSLWLLGGVLPAMGTLRREAPFVSVRARIPLAVWPVVFTLGATILLAWDHFRRTNAISLWLAVATLVVATVRLVLTLVDNRRLLAAREQALLTDELTGLANRRGLAAMAERELAVSRRRGSSAAILMLDIDNLKYVNDALGHRTGDAIIVAVGQAVAGALRDGDVAARLGGDEFAVLLHDADLDGATACAERLCDAVRRSRLSARVAQGQVTISVGVALLHPSERVSWEYALANADAAMYAAKENGRDGHAFHDGGLVPATVLKERFTWSNKLRRALSEDSFELYAQPIVDLASGETLAHELLLRLRDHDRLWLPGAFLPEAERFGLMTDIDQWVIERAIDLARDAPSALTVNISPTSVNDPASQRRILERLSAAGLDRGQLIFEVTETAAVANCETAGAFADRLDDLGCPLALDDFGVGFGSFMSLKQLPYAFVKIDGSFVRGILDSEMDRIFVEAIARAARRLGKRVIAEHVPSAAAIPLLLELGVDMGQAYVLGEPRPVAEAFASARAAPAPAVQAALSGAV
jgi:diguanylate cyclase (GGDEF)-like protein